MVEDETPLRRILKEELEKQLGLSILEAKDGRQGLELALKEHPDVILLDLVMPRTDGMTMLDELRQDDWGKGARVLILTNLEHDGEKTIDAVREGVYEYIVKTRWTLADVVKRVKEKLEN